jgi:hypothetical protein
MLSVISATFTAVFDIDTAVYLPFVLPVIDLLSTYELYKQNARGVHIYADRMERYTIGASIPRLLQNRLAQRVIAEFY